MDTLVACELAVRRPIVAATDDSDERVGNLKAVTILATEVDMRVRSGVPAPPAGRP